MRASGSRQPSLAVLLALSSFHALLRLLPWSPTPVGIEVDDSWSWAFHEVWSRPFVCGREIAFTYGPYGFLLTASYHPATFATRLAVLGAVVLVLVLAVWRIVLAQTVSRWSALAWTSVIVETMALWKTQNSLFLYVPFLILWLDWTRERRGGRGAVDFVLLHALAATVALATLSKFSFFAAALVALLPTAWTDVLRRKSFPWVLPTFGLALVLLWLLAGQPISALGTFLAVSAEIAGGYSEGMSMPSPAAPLVWFLLSASLVLALLAWRWCAGRALEWTPRLLGLAGLLFLSFKAAFVGFFFVQSLPAATFLALWVVAALASSAGRPIRGIAAATAALAFAAIFMFTRATLAEGRERGAPESVADLVESPARQARDAFASVMGRSGFAQRHERTVEQIRDATPLPPLSGSVDVYPIKIGVALAHGLDYRPRPVLQSYCAYTPNLLRRNAEHLAGPRSPDFVLFGQGDWLGGRPPAMADSLSWPILLSRYEIADRSEDFIVLARRQEPRSIHREALPARLVRFGETVRLPAMPEGSCLWAEIDIRPTLLGRVATFLLHPPILALGYRLESGQFEKVRLVPGIARAGFLLGPSIETDEDYVRLAKGDGALWRSRAVRMMLVEKYGGGRTWAYEEEYELRLSTLKFEP